MDRITKTFWIVMVIDILIWSFVARAGDNPYRMPNGWWTCPNGALVDPYGEICIPFVRGPQIVMSEVPSAGEGSSQPDAPDTITYIVPSVGGQAVNNTTNVYIVPGIGTRQGILDRAIVPRR